MKAVILKAYGDVDQLLYRDVEKPKPAAGEVLVKVVASSVNPIDWKLRSGAIQRFSPLELPAVLGRDLAGEVAQIGAGVTGFSLGQRVMALTNGTYAEFAVVKSGALAHMPDKLSFEQAAALPLVTLTGAQLIERGIQPKAGQSLLLSGAVGSVGRTAAYVAGCRRAQVIAVVRPAQMLEAEKLGTPAVVSLDDEDGLATFREIDAFADTVGGAVAVRLLKHLRRGGIFATVVGIPEDAISAGLHAERVTVLADGARLRQLAEDVVAGRLEIPVAAVMKLSQIREAHRLGEAGGAGGKIVLTC